MIEAGGRCSATPALAGTDAAVGSAEALGVGPDAPDEVRLTAWRALLVGHAVAVEAIERDLAAEGLVPLTEYDVLVALWEAPGQRLRLSELARRVVLSRSGLTRLVDRMEAAGHLCRAACPSDRRGAFAVLTPAGRAAQLAAWPVYARGIDARFGRHVSDEEAATLVAVMGRVGAGACAREREAAGACAGEPDSALGCGD